MPDRFPADPARPDEKWLPVTEITWQDERTLKRAGVPMQHEDTKTAVLMLVAAHERAAVVALLRAMANDVYTLENPPKTSWWRRTLWHLDKSGIRDNYIFKGRLERLAAKIEKDIHP